MKLEGIKTMPDMPDWDVVKRRSYFVPVVVIVVLVFIIIFGFILNHIEKVRNAPVQHPAMSTTTLNYYESLPVASMQKADIVQEIQDKLQTGK